MIKGWLSENVVNRRMSAFPKAAVQNLRVGVELNVRLWPKADIRTESKSLLSNVCFGEKSERSEPEPSGVISTTGVALD